MSSSVATAIDFRVSCPEMCWFANHLGCEEPVGILNRQFSSLTGCSETCWISAFLLCLGTERFGIELRNDVSFLCRPLSANCNGNDFVCLACCFGSCRDGNDFICLEAFWYNGFSLETKIPATCWMEWGAVFFVDCSSNCSLHIFSLCETSDGVVGERSLVMFSKSFFLHHSSFPQLFSP